MTALPRRCTAPYLVLLFALAVACGSNEGDSDCDQARQIWGPGGNLGPAQLRESCASGSYGSCNQSFSNCIEGVCTFSNSANDDVCTLTCTGTEQCGDWYCKSGFCQPACTAHTYCDGTLCCYYAPDPADPTECKQMSCS